MMFFRRDLVGMGIEIIPADPGKIDDVRFGDGAAVGGQGVADRQFFEILAEGVDPVFRLGGAFHPLAGDMGEGGGRALQGGALHIVQHTTDTAQLLPAPGPARPAVHHVRQGGAVAGRFLGAIFVDDHNPPMPGGGAQHDILCHGIIAGEQGAHQAALAHFGQLDRLIDIAVGQHRAHRAKSFDIVRGAVA